MNAGLILAHHGHHGLDKPLTGGGVFALLIILGIIFILANPKK